MNFKQKDDRFSIPHLPPPNGERWQESQQLSTIKLSNNQIFIIFAIVISLVVLAFYRGAQQAAFRFHSLAWQPLQTTCRVSFTAHNPKGHGIQARALIQLYMRAGRVPTAGSMDVPTTAVTVPIQLAAGESKQIRSDVAYGVQPGGCQYVEIMALQPEKKK